MRKNSLISYIIMSVLFTSALVLADMDKTITIWGTRVTISGFGKDKRVAKSYLLKALKNNGLYVSTGSPTTIMRLKQEDASVTLTVKSSITGSTYYEKNFYIPGKGYKPLRDTIEKLVQDLRESLPYQGVIYSKRSNIVKINAGRLSGVRQGDVYETVVFTGDAPKKFIMDSYDFDSEVTGEIEILSVKRTTSIAKIISESSVGKFDKVLIDREVGRFSPDPIRRGLKIYAGTALSSLSVTSVKESTAIKKPDTGKKLTLANPIPCFGMSAWFTKKYGASVELQYRKVPLTLDSGTELKATYMVVSPEFLMSFDRFSDDSLLSLALGAYMYYNTVDTELMFYVSTKYLGPQVGFDWSQRSQNHTGTLKIRIFPTMALTEDQTSRGESASTTGWYLGLVHDYDITSTSGISSSLFYRSIKTKFSGVPSVGIDEDDTYTDSQYGLKLLYTYFFQW